MTAGEIFRLWQPHKAMLSSIFKIRKVKYTSIMSVTQRTDT